MAHTINKQCNGCTACVRQCPVEAIFKTPDPAYTIDPSLCIDCRVCGIVCPVGAIHDPTGRQVQRIRRDQRPRPIVDADLCNGCGLCADVCAFDCIDLVGRPYLGLAYLAVPLACTSCGDCARVCIKGAVEMCPINLRTYDPAARAKLPPDS